MSDRPGGPQVPAGARLSLIVAAARNGVIGANGRLPWHLPGDLRRFREVTMGHHVVMGRRTWESIGRPLPGRRMVVISRDPSRRVPDALVAGSLDAALAACHDDDEIFVIGGEQVFRAALPAADRLYLTTIDADFEGDTRMPPFDRAEWREVARESHGVDANTPWPWTFSVLDRVRA